MTMTAHEEIPVKVNAWIDRGVAPLVEALSTVPEIITVDSCEGYSDDPAYVMFVHIRGNIALAQHVQDLAELLAREITTDTSYRLTLEWAAGGDHPLATLRSARTLIPEIARCVKCHGENMRHLEAHP